MLILAVPPLLILVAAIIWPIVKERVWPHDSGFTWIVIGFPVVVAMLNAYGIFYAVVGLTGTFATAPALTIIAVILGLAILCRSKNSRRELKNLLIWVVEMFYQRPFFVSGSFIYGLVEMMPKLVAIAFLLVMPVGSILHLVHIWPWVTLNGASGHATTAALWLATALELMSVVMAFYLFATVRPKKLGDAIPRLKELQLLNQANRRHVAHLSDLHIPWGDKLTEEGSWKPKVLEDCVAKLAREDATARFGAIVFSGDVTDTGHPDAWRKFMTSFSEYKNRAVLAPGNHDLNIVGYGVPSIFLVSDEPNMEGRWKRMQAYMNAAAEMMGNRAQVWDGNQLQSLPAAWEYINNEMTGADQWNAAAALFPMVVNSHDAGDGLTFIVWNTVRTSSLALNNSYGKIGDKQLDNFEQISAYLLNNGNDRPCIHVMHHKIGLPDKLRKKKADAAATPACAVTKLLGYAKQLIQLAGMTMLDAQKVAPRIMKHDYTVVLHGHHHASFTGQFTADSKVLQIVSAPSTTLGTEYHVKGASTALGFDVLQLAPLASGWRLVEQPRRIAIKA